MIVLCLISLPIFATPFSLRTTTALTYCGAVEDSESSILYLNARYFKPSLNRFISRDAWDTTPLAQHTSHKLAQELINRYDYAMGNPIMNSDPSGHHALDIIVTASLALHTISTPITGALLTMSHIIVPEELLHNLFLGLSANMLSTILYGSQLGDREQNNAIFALADLFQCIGAYNEWMVSKGIFAAMRVNPNDWMIPTTLLMASMISSGMAFASASGYNQDVPGFPLSLDVLKLSTTRQILRLMSATLGIIGQITLWQVLEPVGP